MHPNIILEDTTLRDGEQAPGVALSAQKKLKVFDALIGAGVKWLEAGIAAMGGEEVKALHQMLERKDEATIVGWNRGVRSDLETTLGLGFRAIHIGLPTSNVHLKHSVGKDRAWLLQAASDIIKLAKDNDVFVSISAEDVGRTEIDFLQEYAAHVAEAGADRIRLSDTIGILDPKGYASRVKAVKDASDIDVQCHCHNDYGLAVANTLAGLEAGARYFHVCVNAMGERAGMPDLAQMVLALRDFHSVDVGIDTTKLWNLARTLSEVTGQSFPPWQPIVGDNVFAHESGIHVNGVIKSGTTFEPIDPSDVGGRRRLVLGKHSGRATLKYHLEQAGVTVNDNILQGCLDQVRSVSIATGAEVSVAKLQEIYRAAAQHSQPEGVN
ncbi:LeuA family protein [Thioclava sp.]|uniref:LeuA family protein n=1 Tax=Thioclava sp. TaxID=1933450 RepID=UPI003AA8EE51